MRDPAFWWHPQSRLARCLAPLGGIYGSAAAWRMKRLGQRAPVPVICVGNFGLGGSGKTPLALTLATMLIAHGEKPFFVSRGYGGRAHGPLRVDPAIHNAKDVGDEPLLLARIAPVIVSRDKVAGAMAAVSAGASVIVMDDGFQNPSLVKDLSIIAVDAGRGLGNGFVFPAGPLRAPLSTQLEFADAMIVIGEGAGAQAVSTSGRNRGIPVLDASLIPSPEALARLAGRDVLAFAGIGDPEKFFVTLRHHGIAVSETAVFPDHHPFTAHDLLELALRALEGHLTLVTTAKDYARLSSDPVLGAVLPDIAVLDVTLTLRDEAALWRLVEGALARARVV